MIPGLATITALVKAAVVAVTPYMPVVKQALRVTLVGAEVADAAKKVKEARKQDD